jgi:hypothetical protein
MSDLARREDVTGTTGRDAPPPTLPAIAAAPVAEQDRILRTHGGLVADHMANDLVRRVPRLAARSGFARWQRVAGALAALAVVALLVLAPTLLSILGSAIVTITLGQALLAVAGCGATAGAAAPCCRATRSWFPPTRSGT